MLKTIDSVLLAIGPNDREHVDELLEETLAIAVPSGATVQLLHVFRREEYEHLLSEIDSSGGSIPPGELAARHESINTPASRFEELDVAYEIRGAVGEPESEIVRVANELGVDHIVIGGTGRSPAGKAVFGDHAQQVLLNAPCPVTYVRRD